MFVLRTIYQHIPAWRKRSRSASPPKTRAHHSSRKNVSRPSDSRRGKKLIFLVISLLLASTSRRNNLLTNVMEKFFCSPRPLQTTAQRSIFILHFRPSQDSGSIRHYRPRASCPYLSLLACSMALPLLQFCKLACFRECFWRTRSRDDHSRCSCSLGGTFTPPPYNLSLPGEGRKEGKRRRRAKDCERERESEDLLHVQGEKRTLSV